MPGIHSDLESDVKKFSEGGVQEDPKSVTKTSTRTKRVDEEKVKKLDEALAGSVIPAVNLDDQRGDN